MTVVTDHAAVRAVLEILNPSAKHAHWWTCVHGTGLKKVKIIYRPGRLYHTADALSRCPHSEGEDETQMSVVSISEGSIQNLNRDPDSMIENLLQQELTELNEDWSLEQRKDPHLAEVIAFLETGDLPSEEKTARRIALQKPMLVLVDRVLFICDSKQRQHLRVVVPSHLPQQIITSSHSGLTGGHFSAKRMYAALNSPLVLGQNVPRYSADRY